MSESDVQATVKRAEKRLNEALAELEEASSSLQRQILEMRLQACIFQYDICVHMASLIRNDPAGFAASVALRGLVLRLFEYDLILNKCVVTPLQALAKERKISFDQETMLQACDRWKGAFRQIEQWSGVWDQSAADNVLDIATQVKLLKGLNIHRVMNVTQAFLGFNLGLLKVLDGVGEVIPN